MSIMISNKIKIAASVAGTSAVALGMGIPYLTSSNNPEAKESSIQIQPESPKSEIKEPATEVVGQKIVQKTQPQETISSKINGLKNEKNVFLNSVEDSTSSYKNALGKIVNVKQLEEELKKCASKPEVNTNITSEETTKLKNIYEEVKRDIQEFEKLSGKIKIGELKNVEQEAEKYNEDESKYNTFKNKLEEARGEYNSILNKKSSGNFSTLLATIQSKLNLADEKCSLKDLIKMNDALGQRNNEQ